MCTPSWDGQYTEIVLALPTFEELPTRIANVHEKPFEAESDALEMLIQTVAVSSKQGLLESDEEHIVDEFWAIIRLYNVCLQWGIEPSRAIEFYSC